MRKLKLLALLASMAFAAPASAENWGQSIIATGPTAQISATSTSASTTLSPASGYYVMVLNEGSVVAYVTCNAATATVPGGAGPNSTPVPPNGGGIVLNKPDGMATCAAITASSTAKVDFTPINLF